MEILEASRDIKAQNQQVETTVKDAMSEFGSLIHRSKDNGASLSTLINLIEDTRDTTVKADATLKEKFPLIISSLDTQRESQRSLTTVADVLLEQTREFGRKMHLQESQLRKLLRASEVQLEGNAKGIATKEDMDRVVGRGANKVLEEFGQFSETIGAQQQQTVNLLVGLKDYFDKSVDGFDTLYTQVTDLVQGEITGLSTELSKTVSKSSERTFEQLQVLDADLLKVQNSLQLSIAKAINNAATLSHPQMPTHDHMIPEIMTAVVSWEQQAKLLSEKAHSKLTESISQEFQNSEAHKDTQIHEVHDRIAELTSQYSALVHSDQVNGATLKELTQQCSSLANADQVDSAIKKLTQQYSTLAHADQVSDAIAKLTRQYATLANADQVGSSVKELTRQYSTLANCDQVTSAFKELASQCSTLANASQVDSVLSKLDLVIESIHEQYRSQLKTAELRFAEVEEKTTSAELQFQSRISEAEVRLRIAEEKAASIELQCQSRIFEANMKVAEMEASIENMELKLKQQESTHQQEKQHFDLQTNQVLKKTSQAAEKKIAEAEARTTEMKAEIEGMTMKLKQQESAHEQAKKIWKLEADRVLAEASQEADKKIADVSQEAEKKIAQAEQRASESANEMKLAAQDMTLLKHLNRDIVRHEEVIRDLEEKTEDLQAKKAALGQEVVALNTTYNTRVTDLNQLESRVEGFERRLNQAILDRSKSILGSTTMTIINSASDHQHHHQNQLANVKETERALKGTGSPGRRHLSMAPVNFENMAKEMCDYDKENDSISVMKRGSPHTSPKKQQRSVSLFVDK